MSDYILKIILAEPYCCVSDEKAGKTVEYLKQNIKADDIVAKTYDMPVFIDCGSNLEEIVCPVCGASVAFDWWNEAMDTAWNNRFSELSVKLPCCGRNSSLNDLQYHFPCGFSCFEIDILNPSDEPDDACLLHVQKLLETSVRLIRAHL